MINERARALSLIALIAMTVIPATTAADSPDLVATEPLKVVVLPAWAHVARMGLMQSDEAEEWTETARANIDKAIADWVAQSALFRPMPLPALSTEERRQIEEFVAVANLATTQFSTLQVQRTAADRSLGPTLAILQERTGADCAIGTVAFQLEQSKSLAAVGSTLAAGVFAATGFPPSPLATFSYVAVFVADLRTGELRSANVENGYEVGGFNFSDLRDAESVAKTIAKLVKKYPEVPWPKAKKAPPQGAPNRPVSPKQGEFAMQVPEGWRASDYVNMIRATRDGRALNELRVELRSHDRAFPASGGQTTRSSSPAQLAEAFVADLGKQELTDLEIISVSTDAQLVGQSAFRVRYSYRLPEVVGGARIELVTIGTAVRHGLLVARLDGPQLGYFDKALPAFEEAVQSIVLKPRRYLN